MTLSKPALTAAVLLTAACGNATDAARPHAPRGSSMTAASISACQAKTATLHLAPEALMTRAALTAETLAQRYPMTAIAAGDPRLARLTEALRGLAVEGATLPHFDPRMLVTIHCEDGKAITILGSATQPDGRSHLSINGDVVSTTTSFRKTVESLADKR